MQKDSDVFSLAMLGTAVVVSVAVIMSMLPPSVRFMTQLNALFEELIRVRSGHSPSPVLQQGSVDLTSDRELV
jgi:hypothetical protein